MHHQDGFKWILEGKKCLRQSTNVIEEEKMFLIKSGFIRERYTKFVPVY